MAMKREDAVSRAMVSGTEKSCSGNDMFNLFDKLSTFLRQCIFSVLSFGPMPDHIAFILDGNRRFTKARKLEPGAGHRIGSSTLMSTLQYCYEMGVKYVTLYAFSIDNFKRKPQEVEGVMNLILEKIEELLKHGSMVSKYGLRVNFWGDLRLLEGPVRSAAEKLMKQTAGNNGPVLSVCVAYTSVNEIMHAIQDSCREKLDGPKEENADKICDVGGDEGKRISVHDIDKHLFTAGCPDPDILIRTSGESRLSNFLLWQSTYCLLQNPAVLWPDFSLRHLIWAILEYQRLFPYLEKRRKGV